MIANNNNKIAYKSRKNFILVFQSCLTYLKVSRIKSAEMEKNIEMNKARSNYIYITNDLSLSLND